MKNADNLIRVTISITQFEKNTIRIEAAKRGTSMSNLIHQLISEFVIGLQDDEY